MKKTSIKELRSFSKAELIRYVQYVDCLLYTSDAADEL